MSERASLFGDRPIAALFVARGGTYFGLPGVDPWDEERDARLYDGPHPVVAHPPCSAWCRLAGMRETRYGYKRGDDGGCFKVALEAVRRYGGVLEHPAYSAAWDAFGLPLPARGGGWITSLTDPGSSCWVDQGWYGHALKKPTWVYAVGVDLASFEWGESPAGRQLPHRDPSMSATQRQRMTIPTPPEFRDLLIRMARTSSVASAVAA